MLRKLILTVMGHVDHGKTSILDFIRKTSVFKGEAGGITQMISSSVLSLNQIKEVCGKLLENKNITIPGLIAIDTPGHAAFSSLRKRGGSLADIAILVIDINEGIKPQTIESLNILKQSKTPFIIATNKIDLINGWHSNKNSFILKNIESQGPSVQTKLDMQLYEIVGRLHEEGFPSERFDRIDDYTKSIAIVPCSALTGEGLPELLMVVTGLAQKYLEQDLEFNANSPAKGTILEVREQKGVGQAIDAIIYDGQIKVNDIIVIGGIDGPIVTKIRGLFEQEKSKLNSVKKSTAAAAIRISAPDIDKVISGMPFVVAINIEEAKIQVQKEIQDITIETEKDGVVIKADSLGSLEAMINLLKDKKITIKHASIGHITKKDLSLAESAKDETNKVVLGFNVNSQDLNPEVKIITHDIIYRIIEEYLKWRESKQKELETIKLEKLPKPFKIKILKGCIFRQSNPAVVGIEVLGGTIIVGSQIMLADGKRLTEVKSMQEDKENVHEAKKGAQLAISLPNITCGRQIVENQILYSDINEEEFRQLKVMKKYLSKDDVEVLKEIANIKRQDNPVWGA
ncbi:translation initiation factor IF-2 [Candidatus Woesearchaeota archaeon]|nr:translation initiation factor IF-2 [Candidatus Woesearchaeota archaeon]